jgi:hypothetical protein
MDTFDRVFEDVPVGRSTCAHWERQDKELLNRAASKIEAAGANPWVFASDGRAFAQFASSVDREALRRLSYEEANALLDWNEWDWSQALGYRRDED